MDPITGNSRIDTVLAFMGALVPLFSALTSFLNHFIRVQSQKGESVNSALLGAGAVLNLASVNIDKGVQLAKMALGKPVPQTTGDAQQ